MELMRLNKAIAHLLDKKCTGKDYQVLKEMGYNPDGELSGVDFLIEKRKEVYREKHG